MKTGQDYIKNPCASSVSGFNSKILGESYNERFQYPHERTNSAMHAGWNLAEEMIEEGKIYFRHNFHNSHSACSGFAFPYGGTWVCNTCGGRDLNKPWWIIKVYMDGNAWCCVGEGFVDLQESENYEFGDTREEAISNYGDLYFKPEIPQLEGTTEALSKLSIRPEE